MSGIISINFTKITIKSSSKIKNVIINVIIKVRTAIIIGKTPPLILEFKNNISLFSILYCCNVLLFSIFYY